MIFFGNADEQTDVPKYHTTKIQLLKQASEDVIFGNEDEQSYVPKYHASNARQSG